MDSEKLLGCPKCRSAHIKAYDPDGVRILGEPRIVCGWCFLEQPAHTIEAAARAWNTRPTPENGLREALERANVSDTQIIDLAYEIIGAAPDAWRVDFPTCDEAAMLKFARALLALQHNTGERDS